MDATSIGQALLRTQLAMNMFSVMEMSKMYPQSTTLTNNSTYDYIVVGGGTAGCVVATRLAEKRKFKVLLIEAGDDPPYESMYPSLVPYIRNTRANWNYTSENDGYTQQCHVDNVLDLDLGNMLGGTSELNYMVYSRGNLFDYDKWFRITKDPTWKWQNVLPYFIKLETLNDTEIMNSIHKDKHGTDGPLQVMKDLNKVTKKYLQAFKQAGNAITVDVTNCIIGYSQALITANNGIRQGSAEAYLSRVKSNPFLTVAKNSLATRIIFDKNKNAIAVEVINDKNETIIAKATKEIVITAGAVKSPQILMLSGIGPKSHLQDMKIEVIVDQPAVGKNFQDHIAVTLVHKTNKPQKPRSCDPGEYPSPLLVGYVALNKSSLHPDYQAMDFIVSDNIFLLQLCKSTFKYNDQICNGLFEKAKNNEVFVSLISNMYQKSRGQITLRSSNPNDPPNIFTGYFTIDDDLDAFVDYLLDYVKVEDTDFFEEIGASFLDPTSGMCDNFKKRSREYWRCYSLCMMSSTGHYSGTCAMGTVLDGRLRVHGVQRLRVADASIMPTIVSGNTQVPVTMIAEKVAEWLIQDCENV